jgi:hypothetical protein
MDLPIVQVENDDGKVAGECRKELGTATGYPFKYESLVGEISTAVQTLRNPFAVIQPAVHQNHDP